MTGRTLDLPFRHLDRDGVMHVEVGVTDPDRFDSHPGSRGLTWCRAEVEHPAEGYRARFGWVQLVRSDDNRSRGAAFEMDPLEILGDYGHPFAYYGVKPTLFDAPSRDERHQLDWVQHAFLTRIDRGDPLEVQLLAGFSWGFAIRDGAVTEKAPAALTGGDWDAHLDVLRAAHPGWAFRSSGEQGG